MLAASALTALALPNHAAANPFAATTLSPSTQTVNVGTNFSVDVVFAVPAGGYVANGIQVWINFDATKLQAVSISTGAASPFTNVIANQFDNSTGKLTYAATGGSVSGATFTVAKIVFTPIAAGASALDFQNVNEYIGGSPYGVNGLAVDGSVTIVAPPPVTVFASGISPVTAWDPIYPASAYPDWTTESKPVPTVGYDANWTNPHPVSVFPKGSHPWEYIPPYNFDANWINAWSSLQSKGPSGQSWTKYTTSVTGEGQFVLQFLADNASWIYIDGTLIGYQDWNWPANGTGRYTINLSGAGPHELCFIIWDGGGAAGGKFRLETTESFQNNNPGAPLPPPPAPSDTTPPVITAPADMTVEATGASGAVVNFTATAVDDVDGTVNVVANPASGSTFPFGTTTVGLAAADAAQNTAAATFSVTVRDSTAPSIDRIAPSVGTLWPANHKMVALTVGVDASDAVGVVSKEIVSVTSSEPDNGLGDGDTAGDIQITGPLSLNLRAERAGTGTGRTYTITVRVRDAAGNTTMGTVTVAVPKSMGGK